MNRLTAPPTCPPAETLLKAGRSLGMAWIEYTGQETKHAA